MAPIEPDRLLSAVLQLERAAGSGPKPAALAASIAPRSTSEALEIQAALVQRSKKAVAGWKVGLDIAGTVTWGAIFADDCFSSPAAISPERFILNGVEGEIAFRFLRELPRRIEPYSRDELASLVAALPAIEIVDSRFVDYDTTPLLDRLADRMSNGGMVLGEQQPNWSDAELPTLRTTMRVDGIVTLDRSGGHPRNDPFLPAIQFVAAVQHDTDILAGQFVTTGSLTGLVRGKSGQNFNIAFEGLGSVGLTFK